MGIIILFFVELFTILLQRIFCENILTKRKYKKTKEFLIWFMCFAVFNIFTHLVTEIVWLNMVIFIITFFVTLKILYENPTRTILVVTVFLYLGGMCSELIVYYGRDILPIKYDKDADLILFIVISRIIWFLIIKIVSIFIKLNKRIELNIQDWLEVFIVPIGSIWILLALHIESEQDKLVFSLIAVIMVFAINIFTYYIYDKAKETAEKKMREEILIQQCEYYIRQNNESTEWWQELKRFRHDMKQHYILEKTYLDAGNYEALREFCNENLSFISGSNIVSDTGNIYFDSIINFKADVAKIQGIKVVADVRVPKDVRINPEHLSICLGNILDNAIEASEELREDKIIYVYVCVNGKNLFINVKNRYQNARHKIDDKYITSKRNKNQHGFGLEIIKQIVDQYEGELKIIDKNNEFEVEIIG